MLVISVVSFLLFLGSPICLPVADTAPPEDALVPSAQNPPVAVPPMMAVGAVPHAFDLAVPRRPDIWPS